jgi:hypothetical protein
MCGTLYERAQRSGLLSHYFVAQTGDGGEAARKHNHEKLTPMKQPNTHACLREQICTRLYEFQAPYLRNSQQ